MKKLIVLILALCFMKLSAQEDQEIGEWRSFLPYNTGVYVTQSEDKIYYTTGFSVFSIQKDDVTDYRFLSKVDGLSDVGANLIKYDNFNDQLIIAYNNSNIDIIKDDIVYNLSNIKNNLNLNGSRQINDIHIQNEESVFLATAFGMVELNLKSLEFGATIFTNLAVHDLTSIDNTLYAATDDGIYFIDNDGTVNIADFSQWSRMEDDFGLPILYEAIYIESLGNYLFANIDDELLVLDENGVIATLEFEELDGYDMKFISKGEGRVIVGMDNGATSRAIFIDQSLNPIIGGTGGCIGRVLYAIEDADGRIWYADEYSGIRWSDSATGGCHRVITNSPLYENVSDLDVKDGVLYVSTGGVQDNYSPLFRNDGFYIYKNGIWSIYQRQDVEALSNGSFYNNYQIAPHPDENKIYVGSYSNGLLEFYPETGEGTLYDNNTSILGTTIGDPSRVRVSGVAFDEDNNLWITTFGSASPLTVYTEDGNWYSFDPEGDNSLAKVVIDENGYKWSVIGGNLGGVSVYDDNGTIEDKTDDRSRYINTTNSEMTTNQVNSILVDLDGEIWVGTGQGPVIFNSSNSLFEDNNLGSRKKVLQDSIAAFLLATEDILAMEVDGGNRKWFGTRNGIFVQSPDGETLEAEYNTENSPLFDDIITALEFDGDNGVMYIGTNQGLQSIRTQTLGSRKTHASKVYAYPNPVRPEYDGEIAIKGLARDANVKITDMNGKLVYETEALGGQAIWDGRDYNGRKAATGVYYVFSTGEVNFETPDAYVTKIMIVR